MLIPQRTTSSGSFVPAFSIDAEFCDEVLAFSWRLHGKGYLIAKRCGSRLYLHRFIWQLKHGDCPAMLDHKNGDKTDNRLCNLRPATASMNNRNRRNKKPCDLPQGVSLARGCKRKPYKAATQVAGRYVHLGYFVSADAASQAYEQARAELIDANM